MPQDMPPVGGYDAVQYKVGLPFFPSSCVMVWFRFDRVWCGFGGGMKLVLCGLGSLGVAVQEGLVGLGVGGGLLREGGLRLRGGWKRCGGRLWAAKAGWEARW